MTNHKYFNLLLFLFLSLAVFYLTFDLIGGRISSLFSILIDKASNQLINHMISHGIDENFQRLVTEGILRGVGSVISFIPTIMTLFFFISLADQSGYLSLLSLALPTTKHSTFISSYSIAPLIMGFGCSVPAIIAASSIPSRKNRFLTLMLIPFMSCSAKLPIFIMLASIFFPSYTFAIVFSLYMLGILVGYICNRILCFIFSQSNSSDSQAFSNNTSLEIISKPYSSNRTSIYSNLHKPSMKKIFYAVMAAAMGFVKKAFTIILVASILIWLLNNLDYTLHFTSSPENSLLSTFAKLIYPVFIPIGIISWQATAALLCGLAAKESIVSTLTILSAAINPANPILALYDLFSPISAYSFMVFCLLYSPCIGTLVTIKSVTRNIKAPLLMILIHSIAAWICSFLIFNILTAIINL